MCWPFRSRTILNKLLFLHPKERRFTFEWIHNMKEQIFYYETAEKHKANEWMFQSFKRANFPSYHPPTPLPIIKTTRKCGLISHRTTKEQLMWQNHYMCSLMHNSTPPIQQFSYFLSMGQHAYTLIMCSNITIR